MSCRVKIVQMQFTFISSPHCITSSLNFSVPFPSSMMVWLVPHSNTTCIFPVSSVLIMSHACLYTHQIRGHVQGMPQSRLLDVSMTVFLVNLHSGCATEATPMHSTFGIGRKNELVCLQNGHWFQPIRAAFNCKQLHIFNLQPLFFQIMVSANQSCFQLQMAA